MASRLLRSSEGGASWCQKAIRDRNGTDLFQLCSPDSEFAERLANDLRSAGVSLWFDQYDILPGDRWDSAVQNALKSSPWLLVVLSPHSVASENVMDEVAEALKLGKKVVPVLHLQCEIPFRIARLQYAGSDFLTKVG